ncbi:MAG: hypothetical protein ACYTAO_04405 [Planctomycetota bacterium]
MKVPMVTSEEKVKRRKKRGPKRKGTRRRVMRTGADNHYKEFLPPPATMKCWDGSFVARQCVWV